MRTIRSRHLPGLALLLAAMLAVPAGRAEAPSPGGACVLSPRPDTLWSLAQCCAKGLGGNPGCVLADAAESYVLVKDDAPTKPDAYLIIPTLRVTGVEDPAVFQDPVRALWRHGWERSARFPGQGPDRTGLAINSVRGRTQDQLHIHISCLREEVRTALRQNDPRIGTDPAQPLPLRLGPHGHTYRVVRVRDLAGHDSPFGIVHGFPGVAGRMGEQGIAVAASQTERPGFYVLGTTAEGANPGAAEELLDERCAR